MSHPYIERIRHTFEQSWKLPPTMPKNPYPEQKHDMVIVLDANPWNPIHHAWFQFSVNHAKEDICLDGGFEVYAFDRHNHELPPYGRCTSEKDGDWRWSVSDPARKMVFEHTWHIPLPEGVTVIQGAYPFKYARRTGSRSVLMGGSGTIYARPGLGEIIIKADVHLRNHTPPPPVVQYLMLQYDWDVE